jgi:hypothetical protein
MQTSAIGPIRPRTHCLHKGNKTISECSFKAKLTLLAASSLVMLAGAAVAPALPGILLALLIPLAFCAIF